MNISHPVSLFTAGFFLAAVPPLPAADPVVGNVVSVQRAGTKLVDITFEVSDADSDQLNISVEISEDGGGSFVVPVTALSGDTSVSATPAATNHSLVWDAGVDFNQQFNSTMVVQVIANDGSAVGPPPAGMVLIPAGDFQMGRQSGSGGDGELPVHAVMISAFYLDQFEVTKAQWDEVRSWGAANGYTDLPAGGSQGAFHPVHSINWHAAVKWCNARSEKGGLTPVYYTNTAQTAVYKTGNTTLAATWVKWSANGFRLPTEAEWEKAARGTLVGNTYPWGNTIGGADANYVNSGDPFESASVKTTPMGFYDGGQVPAGVNRANGHGLYDIAGNVWEWCWDWHQSDWYDQPGATNTNTRGPTTASGDRGLRGGSWVDNTNNLRCAFRLGIDPTTVGLSIGFRSARGL